MGPLIGSAAIGAVGSLLGIGASQSANKWMMRQQMKYNTSEREASQAWQDQQRRLQNQYSEDMYNQYSSPVALARQYKQAGMNPGLMMQGGSAGSVQASSGSSGSAPSGAMPSMPYMNAPDFTQGFVNIANVFKSLAEAKKAGAETTKLEKMLQVEFDRANIAKEAEQFALAMNVKYQDRERFAQLAIAMNQEGITAQERKNLEEQFRALCYDNDVRKFNVDRLIDRWFWEEQKNITEVGQGQANVKYTEAATVLAQAEERLTNAKTFTEFKKPALLEAYTKVQNAIAEFKEFDNKQRRMNEDVIGQDNFASITMHTRSVFKTYELLTQSLENAIKDGDLKDVQFYRELIGCLTPLMQFGLQGLGAPSASPKGKIGFAP